MNPLEKQEGGSHYKDLPIQPVEFCQRNGLGFCESSVVKYVTRHRSKNGAQDLRKAIHFLELLLELEYPQSKPVFDPALRERMEKIPNCQAHIEMAFAVGNFMALNGISEMGPIQLRK